MKDPIVDEVRKARKEHSELHHYDIHEICKDLKKQEKLSGHPLVSLKPKYKVNKTGS